MFHIIKPGTQIDFVSKRHIWVGISVVALLATFVLFFVKGLNYGIDFTSGAEVRVRVPQTWEISRLRGELEKVGLQGVKVLQIGEPQSHEYLVKVQGDEKTLNKVAAQVESIFTQNGQKEAHEILGVDVVGPAAGSSLKKNGFLAMFYSLLAILFYVAVRFDMRFAPGAVAALFHDSVVVIGIFIITGKQFDLTILAAVLALIGYSNNDTIIVFDRVRETAHKHPELPIEQIVNRSINETLGRTILTSLATLLTVTSLWLFGGSVIENFAFTLMVGIIVGTYSSVFIASSFVIYLTHHQEKKRISAKTSGAVSRKSSRTEAGARA